MRMLERVDCPYQRKRVACVCTGGPSKLKTTKSKSNLKKFSLISHQRHGV